MIRYLQNSQIDKQCWDRCVAGSMNRRVYAFSWYLDQVCPGWDALVEDDYASVFPLTHRKKWGILYLFEPFFTQQLGIFSAEPVTEKLVSEFFDKIPRKFRFVEIHLNSMNPVRLQGYEVFHRLNHEMDLSVDYDRLYAAYSQNARRNLRKAGEHGIIISHDTAIAELINLFRENYGNKEGKLRTDNYLLLERLLSEIKKHASGVIYSAMNGSGALLAAAFVLTDASRHYFLFAASHPAARDNGAMFFLIDHLIRDHSGSNTLLDFEGGNDANLARFYKGFGASEVTYPAVRVNRLPYILWAGIRLIRRFRSEMAGIN